MRLRISRSQRLGAAIGISAAFFLTEISVGFYTHSLALVADAFHYLNDLLGFIIAFLALRVSNSEHSPKELSFGWQRAQVLGAFFNGSLLIALGISVFLQSIERFITLHQHHHRDHHDHHHHSDSEANPHGHVDFEQQRELENRAKHHNHRHLEHEEIPVFGGHDLGMMGVLLHVVGDAANNLGVMVAALVIWLTSYEARFYADPATSMGIAAMIFLSALPFIRQSGLILLESAPNKLDPADVKHDLEKIPGVLAVHELHIWRLNQHKVLASVHVAMLDHSISKFSALSRTLQECFHAWGVHSVAIMPEIATPLTAAALAQDQGEISELEASDKHPYQCQSRCSSFCKDLACCG
ncbi:cation efflux protein [Aspergillus desertorum]